MDLCLYLLHLHHLPAYNRASSKMNYYLYKKSYNILFLQNEIISILENSVRKEVSTESITYKSFTQKTYLNKSENYDKDSIEIYHVHGSFFLYFLSLLIASYPSIFIRICRNYSNSVNKKIAKWQIRQITGKIGIRENERIFNM